jgi:hypothetical protein
MASLVARASRQLRGNEDAENPSRAAKPAEERKRAAFSDLTNVGAGSSKDLGGKPAKTSAGKKVEKEEVPSRPGSSSGATIAAVLPDPKNLVATAPVANPPFAAASAPASSAPFSVVASTNISLWAAQIPSVDRPDAGNTQAVAEYAADIFKYLRERETVMRLKDDYMQSQQDVTEKMRMILVDWLVEVHWKFKLSPDTLFLTIHLLDRYLSHVNVKRTKLQLVGVTCMLLASKHEEIYPPEIKDFVHVTDKAYTKQEILNMEVRLSQFYRLLPHDFPTTLENTQLLMSSCDSAIMILFSQREDSQRYENTKFKTPR